MTRRRDVLAAFAAGLPVVAPAQARFPQRPITLVVPFGPGGIADLTARTVGEAMSRTLGQAVVVDNRPSAGSIVASQAIAAARPDGHTLLLMSNAHAVSVGLFRRLPYDPVRDFAPIGTLGLFDIGLFVAADAPWVTLRELLAQARRRQRRFTVGTLTPGSTQHLAASLFQMQAALDGVLVPYKASPALLTALRAGEVELGFDVLGPMLPQVSAGTVRALAVSSGRRNPALPAVPTVQQAGIAGYDVASWNALAAPAGTPAAVIARLHAAARAALATDAVRERLAALGVRVAAGSPDELRDLLVAEIVRWREVIRRAGIEPQ